MTDHLAWLNQARERLRTCTHLDVVLVEQIFQEMRHDAVFLRLSQPSPGLMGQWALEKLRQAGVREDQLPKDQLLAEAQPLEERLLMKAAPYGEGASALTPEGSTQQMGQAIKAQMAERILYDPDTLNTLHEGRLYVDPLEELDRPLDVYLTPEYVKRFGITAGGTRPFASPSERPEVVLAQLIRFTRELQNHFSGTVHWGFFGLSLLPLVRHCSEAQLRQFAQHLLFEFAQLERLRGGLAKRVILDVDLDVPYSWERLPLLGSRGQALGPVYGECQRDLQRFNHALMWSLSQGDGDGAPFLHPRILLHVNASNLKPDEVVTGFLGLAGRWGNPAVAFSRRRRYCGPLGMVAMNHPAYIRSLAAPHAWRGYSIGAVGMNLMDAHLGEESEAFGRLLEHHFSAHRAKRRFLSRLFALNHRGPLAFLRHKAEGQPFFRLSEGRLLTQVGGLRESAMLAIGRYAAPEELAKTAVQQLRQLRESLEAWAKAMKLELLLTPPQGEDAVSHWVRGLFKRRAADLKGIVFKDGHGNRESFSTGSNTFLYDSMSLRQRFALEAPLIAAMSGASETLVPVRGYNLDSLYQATQLAQRLGVALLQWAPERWVCLTCRLIFDAEAPLECPHCAGGALSPYLFGQSRFSATRTWSSEKRNDAACRHFPLEPVRQAEPALPLESFISKNTRPSAGADPG